jgi:hypothetical protein
MFQAVNFVDLGLFQEKHFALLCFVTVFMVKVFVCFTVLIVGSDIYLEIL